MEHGKVSVRRVPSPEACYLLAAALAGAGVLSAAGLLPVSLSLHLLVLSGWGLALGLVLQSRNTPPEDEWDDGQF